MDDGLTPDDDVLTDRFEFQIRPLIQVVRESIEDQIFSGYGNASVGSILQDAPADACVRLAEAIGLAEVVGVSSDVLINRFDPIDRFIIEMVTGIYSNSQADLFGHTPVSVFDTGRFAQPV